MNKRKLANEVLRLALLYGREANKPGMNTNKAARRGFLLLEAACKMEESTRKPPKAKKRSRS